ncbi:hypothetical protein ACHHYP_20789 [Achlya hypogyna]|uniref:Secreted protein n=1 Tax=Achlya hypogyna TaxID=1202772 RepID=A0A1V9Y9Q3_ACHHY|nr:hypothetical protein ACHHYP_20789 [Achlya hypogyna]
MHLLRVCAMLLAVLSIYEAGVIASPSLRASQTLYDVATLGQATSEDDLMGC